MAGKPLPRAPQTLKKRSEFVAVAKGGRRARRAFVLQAIERSNDSRHDNAPRVGYTVTKKVGCAVVRNRIRRRLRAAMQAAGDAAMAGTDYVVVGRGDALRQDFAELVDELRDCLARPRTKPDAGPRRRRPSKSGRRAPEQELPLSKQG